MENLTEWQEDEVERKRKQAEWVIRICPQCRHAAIREHITRVGSDVCKWCKEGRVLAGLEKKEVKA